MTESTTIRRAAARRPQDRLRAAFFTSAVVVLLFLSFCLEGCATVHRSGPSPAAKTNRETRAFAASLLHQGMGMSEVRRIEGRPQRTFTMTSRSMTITEWIYEHSGNTSAVYFANGVLESWSS